MGKGHKKPPSQMERLPPQAPFGIAPEDAESLAPRSYPGLSDVVSEESAEKAAIYSQLAQCRERLEAVAGEKQKVAEEVRTFLEEAGSPARNSAMASGQLR